MAIGAITMILTNVGLQIYNNWCGSRQNSTLQQKREEFERAARERNTEHMWKLLREGQELTMQLEKEKHDDRLKELKREVDNLLLKLTLEAAITNWPLKVLPIVMKNQAIGNLLAKQEERVAMHVIFARSNYDKFNKLVFPIIEKNLESYCNKHWSTTSDHPIMFYSGAWKAGQNNPTKTQVDSMRTALSTLPTLLIVPYFRPSDGKLVFQLHMWGVGANSSDPFDIPEIEPKSDEFHFQRTYTNEQDYDKEVGLLDEIVEDLVPYLECMIGYMADTYFWASSGLAPHLPLLVTNGTINTDGMKYLVSDSREYYDQLLLTSEEKAKENPFMQQNLLNLCRGTAELWDEEYKKAKLEDIKNNYVIPEEKSLVSQLCPIEDFDGSLYGERTFETIDILQDVLVFLRDRMNDNIQDNLYLFLRRIEDGLITSNVIDDNNVVHTLSPSVDFIFRYDKLYKARKVKEFFCGKREKLIAVDDISSAITRLQKIYESQILTY